MDETLAFNHSNESYWAVIEQYVHVVLFFYAVQGGSSF